MEIKKSGESQGDDSSRIEFKRNELSDNLNGQTPDIEAVNHDIKLIDESLKDLGRYIILLQIVHQRRTLIRREECHFLSSISLQLIYLRIIH